MNRTERNTIREATHTIDALTARVAELEAERDSLTRSNRWLRTRVNTLLRERDV